VPLLSAIYVRGRRPPRTETAPIGADAVRGHDRVVPIFVKPQIEATAHISRRDRLGGILHKYQNAA
jgi:hypothetical protein